MKINDVLVEFAPSGDSGGSGDYFQALASAWYNGTFDSGSLEKGIKSQQDVEQLLQRGIIGPDGVTRKYGIDYNSTFDGVVISSDDYYEHADHDETDSRTGKPFGPYDYMEFGDEELDEDLTEFAPDSNDGGGEDDALRNYARMWWAGDEATQMQIERALAKMGWEIGEDEGGYDNGGVFVVRAGDINGDSYTSWAAEDLTEDMSEGWREESQDLEDWAKEVNKKLYKAHASQRPALAQQLSQLEHKHFGSPANPLTRIVKSALTALGNGQMSHYDSDKVGAMPFGSLVGDDAKEISAANLHASENQGYSILKRNRIVDTVDDFLRLVDVVRTLPPEYLFKYKDAGGQAWFEIVKDIGWSKDDAPGQRYRVSQGVAEGSKKSEPPEADYGADYQDMVSRVKKLAGLGPLRTVYDPQKRVYKNMPTAVQPKKEQR